MFHFVELEEKQLRQLSDAQTNWRHFLDAKKSAEDVRGSMRWKAVNGKKYLIKSTPAGADRSLGPEDAATTEMFERFTTRKAQAEARLKAMREAVDTQRRLNRAFRVGRTPAVVVDPWRRSRRREYRASS